MLERFLGPDGKRRLVEALCDQALVCGESDLAEALADVCRVAEFPSGHRLIEQNGSDNELFLIIAGEVVIEIHGREIARRRAKEHVGEMAVIDPGARRSAGVIVAEPSVIASVAEGHFAVLGDRYPRLWRRVAKQLAERLRHRNALVRPVNAHTQLFIGSSREGLAFATEIQAALRLDPVSITVWTDNVFTASHYPLEDLALSIDQADLALLIATPDDSVASRGSAHDAPRDNIIFELGLFMGALGRRRCFILRPRGIDLKLPTDLLGLTPLEYDPSPAISMADRVIPVCRDLRRLLGALRSR
jgi:predicted nucleotide-binding protein